MNNHSMSGVAGCDILIPTETFFQCTTLCSAFSGVDLLNVNCLWLKSERNHIGKKKKVKEGRKEEDK